MKTLNVFSKLQQIPVTVGQYQFSVMLELQSMKVNTVTHHGQIELPVDPNSHLCALCVPSPLNSHQVANRLKNT